MRLSARNVLEGTIREISQGPTSTRIKLELAGGAVVTSSITTEAAQELALAVGDKAFAVIKASDVMIGKR